MVADKNRMIQPISIILSFILSIPIISGPFFYIPVQKSSQCIIRFLRPRCIFVDMIQKIGIIFLKISHPLVFLFVFEREIYIILIPLPSPHIIKYHIIHIYSNILTSSFFISSSMSR